MLLTFSRSGPPPVDSSTLRLLEHHQDQECQLICDWLTPLTFGAQQSDLISRRHSGTGKWLLTSLEYEDWEKRPKKTLLCPGMPGAGKTIMMSIIVDRLIRTIQNNPAVGVAYVYCAYQPQQQQRAEDLLLSLLRQLIQQQKVITEDMRSFYKSHKTNGTTPGLNEILHMLESAVQNFSRVYFLVDALDELHISDPRGQDTFASGLLHLQVKTNLNIFVTSRFVPEILSHFKAALRREIRAHDNDIRSYVDGRISQLLRSNIGKHVENLELEGMVRSSVVSATDGM